MATIPAFDKDLELLKITMLAEELRASHFARIGLYLSMFVTLFAGDFVLIGITDPPKVIAFVIILTIGLGFIYQAVKGESIHYRCLLPQLDPLLRSVATGASVGDFGELVKKFRELRA